MILTYSSCSFTNRIINSYSIRLQISNFNLYSLYPPHNNAPAPPLTPLCYKEGGVGGMGMTGDD